MKLTWQDLLIEDHEPDDLATLLSPWSFLLHERVSPIFVTKFGSWFLRRPTGEVVVLDVLKGEVRTVAKTFEAFQTRVNSVEWHEQNLFSPLVYQLHQAGKIPRSGECYAIVPHPALGGPNPAAGDVVDPARVMVMSLRLWQSLCRQSLGGPP
jgi:hypothetical protein